MADDYIKQQTAIDAICTDWCGTSNADCKNPFNPEKDEYYHCDGCGDVELIKALSSEDVQTEQRWIPCSERMPNGEEYIQSNGLFIVSDGNRAYAEYFDIYDKKCFGEHTMCGFRADMAVTAWMQLPKP